MSTGLRFILRWIAASFAVSVACSILPDVEIGGNIQAWLSYIVLGLILTLMNIALRPVMQRFNNRVALLIIGFAMLLVSTFLLYVIMWINNALFGTDFWIYNAGSAFTAALIISAVTLGLSIATGANRGEPKANDNDPRP